MKTFKLFFIVVLALLVSAFAIPLGADDVFNRGQVVDLTTDNADIDDYDNCVAYYETATTLTYIFKATWVDSSNHLHSKPFFIGGCNDNDAYVRAVVNAASDVNVVYHYSYDNRQTWVSETPADLDATSNTAKGDTIGIVDLVDSPETFHSGVWMIVEFQDGSTNLNDDEYCTWVASFRKDVSPLDPHRWLRIAQVANGSYTNP